MAKRYKKSARGPKWEGDPTDAMKLAALRWFALMIEGKAISIYATDRDTYPKLEAILRDCMRRLEGVSPRPIADPGDCPPGFVMCGSDCAPMCVND